MLPTFAIRKLNHPDDIPGIVQITSTQYDQTLRSQPDAALKYLDYDDGELVTVGSGLELTQRLEEPVTAIPDISSPWNDWNDHDGELHTFEIKQSDSVLAVWRDHEAYSGKLLHKRSNGSIEAMSTERSCATGGDRLDTGSAESDTFPIAEEVCEPSTPALLQPLEAPKMHHEMRRWTDKTQTFTVLARLLDLTAVRGDAGNAKVWLLKSNGVKISVGPDKLSSEDLEYVHRVTDDEDRRFLVGRDYVMQLILLRKAIAKRKQPEAAEVTIESTDETALDTLDTLQSTQFVCGGSRSVKDVEAPAASEVHSIATEPSTINSASTAFEDVLVAGLKSFASFLTVTAETFSAIADRKGSTSTIDDVLTGFRTIATEAGRMGLEILEAMDREKTTSANEGMDFVQQAVDEAESTHQGEFDATEEKALVFDTDRSIPLPDVSLDEGLGRTNGSENVSNTEFWSIPCAGLPSVPVSIPGSDLPPLWVTGESLLSCNPEVHDYRKSILDIDTADNDFSARYPPLMSVRRAKTVSNLRERSRSPASRPSMNTKSALSRYPSVRQLEQRHRTQRPARKISISDLLSQEGPRTTKRESNSPVDAVPISSKKGWTIPPWSKRDERLVDIEKGRQIEQAEEIRLDTKTTTPRLPGAWPDQKVASPSMGDRSWETAPEIEAIKGAVKILTPAPLRRANTIATNPAARLTKPFDPVFSPRPSRHRSVQYPDVPRASGSWESQPKRPTMEMEYILREWFYQHVDHPYPNDYEKQVLCTKSGLTLFQINNWFINERRHSLTFRGDRTQEPNKSYAKTKLSTATLSNEDFSYIAPVSPGPRRARSVHFTPMPTETRPRSPPYPVPQAWQTPVGILPRAPEPTFPRPIPAPMHSRRGRNGRVPEPLPTRKVKDCVAQLEAMGYGNDPNEKGRLHVYASAADGDVVDAVEMIEEEREAVSEMLTSAPGGEAWEDEGRIRLEDELESGLSMTDSGRLQREI